MYFSQGLQSGLKTEEIVGPGLKAGDCGS